MFLLVMRTHFYSQEWSRRVGMSSICTQKKSMRKTTSVQSHYITHTILSFLSVCVCVSSIVPPPPHSGSEPVSEVFGSYSNMKPTAGKGVLGQTSMPAISSEDIYSTEVSTHGERHSHSLHSLTNKCRFVSAVRMRFKESRI